MKMKPIYYVISIALLGAFANASESSPPRLATAPSPSPTVAPEPTLVKCKFEEDGKGGRNCKATVEICPAPTRLTEGSMECNRVYVVTCDDETVFSGPFGAAAFTVTADLPAFLIFAIRGTPPRPSAPELYVEGALGSDFKAFGRLRLSGEDAINGFCRGSGPGFPN